MRIVQKCRKRCPCCMEEHEVHRVEMTERNLFKGVSVEYPAEYFYCDRAEETYADEQQISSNDMAMKNAYRAKANLLTSYQIAAIRARYGITQKDLCILLGWGEKTITRYESHQVQDAAHDTILRKLDSDPEWFLQLLIFGKEFFSEKSYTKYTESGLALFEQEHDRYLRSAILSKYARFRGGLEAAGGIEMSLDVVGDVIRYYANSRSVTSLFLVKLIKLLWYADALSFKRRGHAITGLVYRALPMGAVPVAYESIVDLSVINCEEIEMGDGTAFQFLPTEDKTYSYLAEEDIEILETVIRRFGSASKKEIVEIMHKEDAYINTAPKDIISFRYTNTLSLS